MPRPIVVGNGKLLINFDTRLNMRDLYYPYVGQLNQIGGQYCRLGVWVDGVFSWCCDEDWAIHLDYKKETLVSHIVTRNERLGIELIINDGVHQRDDIFLKRIQVRNLRNEQCEVRVFLHQDFSINETEVGDTVVYEPTLHAIYHYKRNVYLLVNGLAEKEGIYQYSIGTKRFNHAEGTWRDAEDGLLGGNPIAQGSVDSTISFRVTVPAYDSKIIYYWLCAGPDRNAVKKLNQYVLDSSPGDLLDRVEVYWKRWVNKLDMKYADLPEEVIHLYKRSLLIVRTQADQNGAILAANDSDILQFNRDHYSYMWPRDGALVAYAMSIAGYDGIANPFFEFCAKALTDEGYMLHKYNPDGSAGSSWHPYISKGKIQLPIQEDETGLVLFSLWKHYEKYRNLEFVQKLYVSLIRPAAKFLKNYVLPQYQLPQPSYDLWEERRGIFLFTSCTIYGGLQAAANFANLFGDFERERRYAEAAEKIKSGILTHLYDAELGRFVRGVYVEDQELLKDFTLESSLFGIFEFGVLPATDERVKRTMETVLRGLKVKTQVGGYARYHNDYYFQKSQDIDRVPGNPWIICTLWMTEYKIATAESLPALKEVIADLEWVAKYQMSSGVLPEQLHPYDGSPLSVAPLTWSHSTFVLTVNKYINRYKELNQNQRKLQNRTVSHAFSR
ncbi:MAG TPA: glycoside hydrolase family 15 protein [Bacillota bacterium]|nr:glycoside hydrolase family 15 protein [Bacillota bacterium]